MKIAWHIFLKDARRLRWPLLLWGTLIVAQYAAFVYFAAAAGVYDAPARPGNWRVSPGDDVQVFLWALQLLVGWLLVAPFIQDDSLVGDDVGWRTRPISGARLLGAKLVGFVLLFMVWPSLATLPWWLDFGFGAGETIRVMAVNGVGLAGLATLALMVAVLTRTFVRFVAWSLVLLFAIGMAVFMVSAESSARLEAGEISRLLTQLGGAMFLATAGAVVVVLIQFLTRRADWAVAVIAIAAVMTGLMVWQWKWSGREILAAIGPSRLDLPTISVRVTGHTVFQPPPGPGRRATLEVALEHTTPKLAARDGLHWRTFEATLRHGSAGRLPITTTLDGVITQSQIDEIQAMESGMESEERDRPRTMRSTARVHLPAAIVPRLFNGAARLEGETTGRLWDSEVVARFPFESGRGGGREGQGWHIQSIGRDEAGSWTNVDWVETSPILSPGGILRQVQVKRSVPWRETLLRIQGVGASEDLSGRTSDRGSVEHVDVGLIRVAFRGWSRGDNRQITVPEPPGRWTGAQVIVRMAEEVAPMSAAFAATPLTAGLLVQGRIDAALAQARLEGKYTLLMHHSREFSIDSQRQAPGWSDPKVRELLRTRFVCAQIFGADDPRYPVRFTSGGSRPTYVVFAPDGREVDAFRHLSLETQWLTALTEILEGRTHAAYLRTELEGKGGTDRALRSRLAETLLARGDIREAVSHFVWLAENDPTVQGVLDPQWGTQGLSWRLREIAAASEVVRTILREERLSAIARLREVPQDVPAARRLHATTFALHDQALMAEFPRVLPRENPAHWGMLVNWIFYLNREDAAVLGHAAFDWEEFFREGRTWVIRTLAEMKARDGSRYGARVHRYRSLLLAVGARGVETIAPRDPERAHRFALEVLQVGGDRWARDRMARALKGKIDPRALHEIDPYGH